MSKITMTEFIQKVWEVERIKLEFVPKPGEEDLDPNNIYVDDYPYTEPMDGNCTVDDFFAMRIDPIILGSSLDVGILN